MTRAVVSGHSAHIAAWRLTGAARINLTPRTEAHCVASGGALAGTSGSKAQEHRGAEGNRALQVWLTWFQISALSLSSWVTPSKLHRRSEPPFPHVQTGMAVFTCRCVIPGSELDVKGRGKDTIYEMLPFAGCFSHFIWTTLCRIKMGRTRLDVWRDYQRDEACVRPHTRPALKPGWSLLFPSTPLPISSQYWFWSQKENTPVSKERHSKSVSESLSLLGWQAVSSCHLLLVQWPLRMAGFVRVLQRDRPVGHI